MCGTCSLLLGSCLVNRTLIVLCGITVVMMLNKGFIKNPHTMIFLRVLFWLSASFNFCLKAYHIPDSGNVEANLVSRFHDSTSVPAYCCILEKRSIDIFFSSAYNHISVGTFQFLLGKCLQLPMFCEIQFEFHKFNANFSSCVPCLDLLTLFKYQVKYSAYYIFCLLVNYLQLLPATTNF